jgi:hypothetical protein
VIRGKTSLVHSKSSSTFIITIKRSFTVSWTREGRVENIKKKLITAASKCFPARTVTKDDLIHLWDKSVEFDNFSDQEIATGMSSVAGNGTTFTVDEVVECRRGSKTLNDLYRERIGDALPKVKNLLALFDAFVFSEDPSISKRPIVDVLKKVANLAALNHQPVTADIKKLNQNSGFFADKP